MYMQIYRAGYARQPSNNVLKVSKRRSQICEKSRGSCEQPRVNIEERRLS